LLVILKAGVSTGGNVFLVLIHLLFSMLYGLMKKGGRSFYGHSLALLYYLSVF